MLKEGDIAHVKVELQPVGWVNLKISMNALNESCKNEYPEADEELSITLSDDAKQPELEIISGHDEGTPVMRRALGEELYSDVADSTDFTTPSASTVSSSMTNSDVCGNIGDLSEKQMEKKILKLAKRCEEARARAFAEASSSLQKGVEIDNLSTFLFFVYEEYDTHD